MDSLKDAMKQPVHQRDIKICTFATENNQVIVEGTLIDNRLVDTYHLSGENRPQDTIHHLIIRILVDEKLFIRQVETEMPRIPQSECPETIDSLQQLVGMKIIRGFTMKVKKAFNHGHGCSHLSELIISMAPAAIQGYFTAVSRNPLPTKTRDTLKLVLADTCWVWRSNGPALKRLKQ